MTKVLDIKPYYQDEFVMLYHGDCRELMPRLNGVTAVVSDPPYGLSFMGKGWDKGVPGEDFWRLASKACLPGAPMLAFGGTRTYHRLVCAIEDAGWEIRDCLQWIYGSGFPKSHNISKGIDKAAGAERKVVGENRNGSGAQPHKLNAREKGDTGIGYMDGSGKVFDITEASTESAKLWDGYGTALKPAHEPICLAMNPLDGTFAVNALERGVAGMNINGARVGQPIKQQEAGWHHDHTQNDDGWNGNTQQPKSPQGRWPANIIHDGSEEVLNGFPLTAKSSGGRSGHTGAYGGGFKQDHYGDQNPGFGDSGTAARFFYCAKASKSERNAGCQDGNIHPTVKPVALMRYLCTLVTMPERNLILDPFAGSGTTGVACKQLGIQCILIEQDEHHCDIIAARCSHTQIDESATPDPQEVFAL